MLSPTLILLFIIIQFSLIMKFVFQLSGWKGMKWLRELMKLYYIKSLINFKSVGFSVLLQRMPTPKEEDLLFFWFILMFEFMVLLVIVVKFSMLFIMVSLWVALMLSYQLLKVLIEKVLESWVLLSVSQRLLFMYFSFILLLMTMMISKSKLSL